MNLRVCLLKENDCYKAGRKLSPKGVMFQSFETNFAGIFVRDSVCTLVTAQKSYIGRDACPRLKNVV